MKKPFLLVLCVCTSFSNAHAQVRRDTTPDSSFRAFLSRWEKAQSAFINGDPTFWKQNASHRDDATILGAFGGYGEKGWGAVGPRYDWASSQYKPVGATMTVEYLSVVASGDLAFTVGIERQEGARVGDQNTMQRALRATQIFRREAGTWKLLHRHADPLIEKKAPTNVP
jgi:ketosteroid isomerase-like protein